jgi:transposase
MGHEVIVANARKVRLIGESRKKDDRLDAQTLARLAQIDPALLCPVKHRSAQGQLAQQSYPHVELLKQIKGVGTLIALTILLTLEDAHRFRKSRDVGCYLGLQPGRRKSGQSDPQLHLSKEGDTYLRTLLVQGAQHNVDAAGNENRLFALNAVEFPLIYGDSAKDHEQSPPAPRIALISYLRH